MNLRLIKNFSHLPTCFWGKLTKNGYCLQITGLFLGIAIGVIPYETIRLESRLVLTPNAQAQIIPDATLPNNSVVNIEEQVQRITGGTSAGSNLFHSFQDFNLRTGETAYFDNALTITNIITRVTGGKLSQIDGFIRANGNANLFLLNPNGIIFGPNARLNIGGSFFGSTAESLRFSDGSFFSATAPNTSPLLTVSVPVGLQLGTNPGAIVVEGTGHNLTLQNFLLSPITRSNNFITGLQVQPGNTLALVGGELILTGGTLAAEGGTIELGSGAAGIVSLNPTSSGWTFSYEGVPSFRNIQLSQRALVDASGAKGGSIRVQGQNLSVTDGSAILIQTRDQPAGNLSANLAESIELMGVSADGRIRSSLAQQALGAGQGGDIAIATKRLVIQGGAEISSRTFGVARAGNISAIATNTTDLIGFSPLNLNLNSNISSVTLSSGAAGDLHVSTGQLTVRTGALISSSTLGRGSGGNITVNATDSVEVTGLVANSLQPASLGATTFGAGKAGNLLVNAPRVTLRDGGRISASTFATGDAGSVTVNASVAVEVSGIPSEAATPSFASSISSSALTASPITQRIFGLPPAPSGSSGDVTIYTPALKVTDGASISVRNEGTGTAGALRVNTNSIRLDRQGRLTASTASGAGGNIALNVRESVQLRTGSQMTAEAGMTGNGGNITIDTDTLVLQQGSRITANAFQGAGGNIHITTQGLFASPNSAITASSQLGVNGIVTVNTPDINTSAGLVELSTEVTNATDQVVVSCAADSRNSFTLTGRGGLPEDPVATVRGQTLWQDIRDLTVATALSRPSTQHLPSSRRERSYPLVEVTGWSLNPQGEVELVAALAQRTSPNVGSKLPKCGA